jgi:hypothetical protein
MKKVVSVFLCYLLALSSSAVPALAYERGAPQCPPVCPGGFPPTIIPQTIAVDNTPWRGEQFTAEMITSLNTNFVNTLNILQKNGTLAQAQTYILAHASSYVNSPPASPYSYQRMGINGFVGAQGYFDTWYGSAGTPAERQQVINNIKAMGLYAYLMSVIPPQLTIYAESLSLLHGGRTRLLNASFTSGRLLNVDYCPVFEGAFLWITAIGAVASLGGVDPLGDLLLTIGAVGEAVTYISC